MRDREHIGRRILHCRENAGMTQTGLAKHLDVTKGAVSAWENGLNGPKTASKEALCKLFDVSYDWMSLGINGEASTATAVPASRLSTLSPVERAAVDLFQKVLVAGKMPASQCLTLMQSWQALLDDET